MPCRTFCALPVAGSCSVPRSARQRGGHDWSDRWQDAWEATERTKQRSKRIIRQRIDSAISNNQFPVAQASPCEEDPSGIGCSEYPSGRLTPEYVKAKYGPDMKIPGGAVREVEGDDKMMDGSRKSYPESQYDYEWRHLTSKGERSERSDEGLRARQRMAREDQEEYPREAPAQHYFKVEGREQLGGGGGQGRGGQGRGGGMLVAQWGAGGLRSCRG
eukprot:187272-Hanusia_phi.AAC.3